MGRLLDTKQQEAPSSGRLSQGITAPQGRIQTFLSTTEVPKAIEKKQGFFSKSLESIKAFSRGEIKIGDVAKEAPQQIKKTGASIVNTFLPATKKYIKTTGNIFGEGLAYAFDKNVREQYLAGNIDVLPTITKTNQKDLTKTVIAAGIEIAVYKSFPEITKLTLAKRGGAGALQGIGFALSEGIANNKSTKDIVESLPLYGVSGSVIGAITPALTKILEKEITKAPEQAKTLYKELYTQEKLNKTPEPPVIQPAIQKTEVSPQKIAVPQGQLPVQGTGDIGISKLESRTTTALKEVTPAEASDLGLETYRKIIKADQIKKGAEYVQQNPKEALAILKGEKNPPEDLLFNSIAIAMKKYAAEKGDAELAIKLASLRSTRAGQEIGILTEIDKLDPTNQITDILKSRSISIGKKLKIEPQKEIQKMAFAGEKELKKEVIKFNEAQKLLDSILC